MLRFIGDRVPREDGPSRFFTEVIPAEGIPAGRTF